jgi:hypothetical protein
MIQRLRTGDEYQAAHSPYYETAMRVLNRWRRVLAPGARELGGKRLVHCVARLNGNYSELELDHAVDGYGHFPYIVNKQRSPIGRPTQWCADAEFIFRNAKNVEQGWRLAEQQTAQIPPSVLETVSWRYVRDLNRRAIVVYLTECFGRPLDDGNGYLDSPCPRCDDGRGVVMRLRIAPGLSYLANCSNCGLSDVQLLEMIADPSKRTQVYSSSEVGQMALIS